MENLKEGDPISIVWLDTTSKVEWTTIEDIKLVPTRIETRGFYLGHRVLYVNGRDWDYVVVAGSKQHTEDGEYGNIDVIPTGCIVELVNHSQISQS